MDSKPSLRVPQTLWSTPRSKLATPLDRRPHFYAPPFRFSAAGHSYADRLQGYEAEAAERGV